MKRLLARFKGKNGSEYELEKAKKVFDTELFIIVDDVDMRDFVTYITFRNYEGKWNSVMFEFGMEYDSQYLACPYDIYKDPDYNPYIDKEEGVR